jgi:hypothetical protein
MAKTALIPIFGTNIFLTFGGIEMAQKKLTGAEADVPVVQVKHVPLSIQRDFKIYALAHDLSHSEAFIAAVKALLQKK